MVTIFTTLENNYSTKYFCKIKVQSSAGYLSMEIGIEKACMVCSCGLLNRFCSVFNAAAPNLIDFGGAVTRFRKHIHGDTHTTTN